MSIAGLELLVLFYFLLKITFVKIPGFQMIYLHKKIFGYIIPKRFILVRDKNLLTELTIQKSIALSWLGVKFNP